jgi:peptidoglycan hydrolase CwlO-like protein
MNVVDTLKRFIKYVDSRLNTISTSYNQQADEIKEMQEEIKKLSKRVTVLEREAVRTRKLLEDQRRKASHFATDMNIFRAGQKIATKPPGGK